jgi:hypothetical protein
MITRYRPILLALLAVLVQLGVIPEPVALAIQSSPIETSALILAVWAFVAWRRNRALLRRAQEK